MSQSIKILKHLVSFNTVCRTPNMELIDFARHHLEEAGVSCQVLKNEAGTNANLFATIGPSDRPGVMLSGHTDVVPVEGQNWSSDPFQLKERDDRFYGRGTADMKGFIACVLHMATIAAKRDLTTPLHIALSYDEEIGCIGVRRMLDVLTQTDFQPRFCIVGEPTGLSVATGHKGKIDARATCIGKEAHSSLTPSGFNAIHLACDFIQTLRNKQADLEAHGARDGDYDVPYTTLHAGIVAGGVALNIVPNQSHVDFEIRNIKGDDPLAILEEIKAHAVEISAPGKQRFPETGITIDVINSYPGLDTPPDAEIVSFVKSLTGGNSTTKVSFGTEGGLFNERLGVPTVVCGPGSMDQGHKPDEFITRSEIEKCDAMLDALLEHLSA